MPFAARKPSPGGTSSTWCTQDEVAIDFPSMDGVLDRIRADFFGADVASDIAEAELALSRAEASRGLHAVVDVAGPAVCQACGGRGEVWADACGGCRGAGRTTRVRRVRLSIPPGVRHGARMRLGITELHDLDLRIVIR